MSDIVKVSSKELDRARRIAMEVRDAVVPRMKDIDVKVKGWEFAAGRRDNGTTIDVAIKLELKPKHPLRREEERKPATPP